MTETHDTTQGTPPQADSSDSPVSREALYEMVWSEPMLRVAARFDVSSSYMARVCTLLNVPRPERGYWAKLAVGKAPKNRHSPNRVRAIRSSGRETEPCRKGPDPSRSLPTSRLGENARYSGNFQIGIRW